MSPLSRCFHKGYSKYKDLDKHIIPFSPLFSDHNHQSSLDHHKYQTISNRFNILYLSHQANTLKPPMQTYRIVPRSATRVYKPAVAPARTVFNTPFFPGHFGPSSSDFALLFRLLDSSAADLVPSSARTQPRRSFTPRFDVREIGAAYELQGELPGIEQKDLEIEFLDERTLVIRGSTWTESTKTNEPAPAESTAKAVEACEAVTADNVSEKSASYHKASVEDEYIDAAAESATVGAETLSSTPATPAAEVIEPQSNKAAEPSFKYWISERSVGGFERKFNFPGRVDQEAVKASLRNGILSIFIPKVVSKEARRINIE